jgi:type IV secretory pathway ATPase VirB11/archaellum biosynthesis ATPase
MTYGKCKFTIHEDEHTLEQIFSCKECHNSPLSSDCLTKLRNNVRIDKKGKLLLKSHISYLIEDVVSIFTDKPRYLKFPSFMVGVVNHNIPDDANIIEEYEIDKCTISIIALPYKAEKMYLLDPPEYRLTNTEIKTIYHLMRDIMEYDVSHIENLSSLQREIEFYSRSILKDDHLWEIFRRHTSGYGTLEYLFQDDNVQDIYLYPPPSTMPVQIVHRGEEMLTNLLLLRSDIASIITKLRMKSGRPFSEAEPILDTEIEEYRVRVAAISRPLSQKGVAIAFRRHKRSPWTLPQLIHMGMLSPEVAGFLSFLVDAESSILITGSRGAGKTSLLSSMLLEIPQNRRILIIEDTPELPVTALQETGWKVQGMITRPVISSSSSEITPEDALRAALRLGESVLVIGEVRGEEAKVLYEAMRVGTAGNSVLGTIHGASSRDVMERVVYDIGVPLHSFKATDVVVVCTPVRPRGGIERIRVVTEIAEVDKEGGEFIPLLTYHPKKGHVLNLRNSKLIEKIAQKWGISRRDVSGNIYVRAEIKRLLAESIDKNPSIGEINFVAASNNFFWYLIDLLKDYREVLDEWIKWYTKSR